jgi:hypothetical protein
MSDNSIEPIPHKRPITSEEIAFCHAYVDSGGNLTRAYSEVYDTDGLLPTDIFIEARKLIKRKDLRKEINRIKKSKASENIDPVELLKLNWEVAMRFTLNDIYEEGPDGLPQMKPWNRISKIAKSMIVGIEKEDATIIDGIVVRPAKVRYKFASKSEYMDRLCKMMKLFDDGVKISINNNNSNLLSSGDEVAMLAAIKNRLAEEEINNKIEDRRIVEVDDVIIKPQLPEASLPN